MVVQVNIYPANIILNHPVVDITDGEMPSSCRIIGRNPDLLTFVTSTTLTIISVFIFSTWGMVMCGITIKSCTEMAGRDVTTYKCAVIISKAYDSSFMTNMIEYSPPKNTTTMCYKRRYVSQCKASLTTPYEFIAGYFLISINGYVVLLRIWLFFKGEMCASGHAVVDIV